MAVNITTLDNGLRIVDVSNPLDPEVIG
ncbi:MAG: hypothetical protein HN423_05730, partial [Alphaproteobacteria bacterium]|nr:hypothetical protein [Alphaproteobacteria bacterium]